MSGMNLSPEQLAELSVLRATEAYPAMCGYLKQLVGWILHEREA